MQLIHTPEAWRPDLTANRDIDEAYRIALKSLARRYPELHDEIADLGAMVTEIAKELASDLLARPSVGLASAARFLLTAGETRNGSNPRPAAQLLRETQRLVSVP